MTNKPISDVILQAADGSGYYRRKLDGSSRMSLGTDVIAYADASGSYRFPRADYVAAPPPAPPPQPPSAPAGSLDTLVVTLSEDAYLGNARMSMFLDGTPLDENVEVTALHAGAGKQPFSYQVRVMDGQTHKLDISFLNDSYAGPGQDRNLFVEGVSVNGAAIPGGTIALLNTGTSSLPLGTGPNAPVVIPPMPKWVRAHKRIAMPLTVLRPDQRLLECGPGKQFSGPGPAIMWSNANPNVPVVIRVDPGLYVGDQAAGAHNYMTGTDVVIECADPALLVRLTMDPGGIYSGKGLYIPTQAGRYEFRNLEGFGVQNPDHGNRGNWCFIAAEPPPGPCLISVLGCIVHSCNNGVGRGGVNASYNLQGSVFQRNGWWGEGYSHGVYLLADNVLAEDCEFTEAQVGHDFKARANATTIRRCLVSSLEAGTSSYRVDVPDGGLVLIEDSTIENGPNVSNYNALRIAEENPAGNDAALRRPTSLTMRNVTGLNSKPGGSFVFNSRPDVCPVVMTGTKVFGFDADKVYQDGAGGGCPDAALDVLASRPALGMAEPA